MLGIEEMFAEFDGYERYDDALEVWAANATKRRARRVYLSAEESTRRRLERARLYMSKRYREDPDFRARHLAAARARKGCKPRIVEMPQHGTVYRYRKYKCRCTPCRLANNQAAREWYGKRRAA